MSSGGGVFSSGSGGSGAVAGATGLLNQKAISVTVGFFLFPFFVLNVCLISSFFFFSFFVFLFFEQARVRDKLTGRDFGNDVPLGTSTQVNKLILQATSHENLSQCYIGWCPFW